MDIQVGDILEMKKNHPCGSKQWKVLYVGTDLKLKCVGCEHQIVVARSKIQKNIKNIYKNQ